MFLLLLMAAGRPAAAECVGGAFGYLVTVQGVVEISTGGGDWQPVKLNAVVCTGDLIRVGQSSRAGIYFDDIETVTYVDQNTTAVAERPGDEKGSLIIRILEGAINFLSREPRSLEIRTPFVNAGVKGTEFEVRVRLERSAADSLAGSTVINLIEGRVEARGAGDTKILTSGQSGIAAGTCPAGLSIEDLRQGPVCEPAAGAPAIRVTARAPDTVQWALYYPPVTADPASGLSTEFAEVNQLLARGRVDQALPILCAEPARGEKSALIAIIELTRNDPLRGRSGVDACGRPSQRDNRQRALDFAEQAVRMSPRSAASWVALSYVQQAYGKLEDARESLEKGVEAEPRNALVHARLAEIWLSLGYRDSALDEATTAKSLASGLSRTQTVYGFAALAEVDLNRARFAFSTAIQLDDADPLPRLGLGLAKIRDGDIAAGRRELEIAAGLDPQNSLIRSYLGKAYFEEKRGGLDATQFDLAKQLDPNDPTPWLYDAIRLQTENRPVEALQSLQKSIDLNNNRAVYRSRLLLDDDLAVRESSAGRVYTELGFDQVALLEGWKSVDVDPGNYSAHRFLADTYATLPRHQIARVSELLQSQLRQPINATPLQPQLAESNLFILRDTGPSTASTNEFSPLFLSNGVSLLTDGVVGTHDTFGDDFVVAAVADNFSVSAGQFHYESDGFRDNNDQEQNIYDVFAQMQFSPDTSGQIELRSKSFERGDLPLRFDPTNFLPNLRQDDQTNSVRVGFHHAFSPASDVIANFQYQDGDFDADVTGVSALDVDQTGFLGEIQHLHQWSDLDLIVGAGWGDVDRQLDLTFVSLPIPPITTTERIGHFNFYAYPEIKPTDNLVITAGASVDLMNGGFRDRNQINPKFGVEWEPLAGTTIRGAAFRTLARTLVGSQTIEPVAVAGFNQFYDDPEGTDSWQIGLGVDQRLSDDAAAPLYAGVELFRRELDLVGLNQVGPGTVQGDGHETVGRAYLYWAPDPSWAFTAEYQFEHFEREAQLPGPEGFKDVETHRASIGGSYFHPSGFTARMQISFIDQEGEFASGAPGVFADGHDDFVVVDAALGYRLPDRYGFIGVVGKNLFDEKFQFQDTDPGNPSVIPDRQFLVKGTFFF